MAKRDYYEILGVSKSADKSEIKKAYRQLAKEKHPDRNKTDNAEEEFKEIQEAYEVLSDEKKRQAYDQYGHAGVDGFGAGGAGYGGFGGFQGGASGYSNFGNASDLNDIFEQFFGEAFSGFAGGARSRTRGTSSRGSDIEANLRIDFEEAVFGKYKNINYVRKVTCDRCDGSGADSAKDVETCDTCKGQGTVNRVRQSFLGTIQTTEVCPTCSGSGKVIKKKCRKCAGEGRTEQEEEFKIKIPPGIPDGVTLRFRDRGNAGKNGGNYGDLYISIEVEQHDSMERRGDDIYSEIDVDVTTAVLGGEREIESVRGKMTVKIPEGTQDGKVLRLSGKGGPRFKGDGNGDHYVKINVNIPTKLSKKQKQLWQELAKIKDKKPGLFG
jgi:molecular chaperone DnaJ